MMEYVGVFALFAACTLVGTIVLPLLSVTDIAILYLAASHWRRRAYGAVRRCSPRS
jgi:hypothetical protein